MLVVTNNNRLDTLVTVDGEFFSTVGAAVKAIREACQDVRADKNLCDLDITFGKKADKAARTSILRQARKFETIVFCDPKTESLVQQATYLCVAAD